MSYGRIVIKIHTRRDSIETESSPPLRSLRKPCERDPNRSRGNSELIQSPRPESGLGVSYKSLNLLNCCLPALQRKLKGSDRNSQPGPGPCEGAKRFRAEDLQPAAECGRDCLHEYACPRNPKHEARSPKHTFKKLIRDSLSVLAETAQKFSATVADAKSVVPPKP